MDNRSKRGHAGYFEEKSYTALEKDKIIEVTDIERVARELHILKVVRHPHIIQMYEIIETPTRLYIIMEHCCNG